MATSMSLRVQLLLLQVVIVLVTVVGTGIVASSLQAEQLREAYLDRMIGVAQSVARLPAITEAFDSADPAMTIQPIAEVIREASKVTYVVVANTDGIRYSHPNPERIGQRVSTDPSIPLSGKIFVGTETGTLGESWRAKVPIFGDDGKVIGQVSVGILESDLQHDFLDGLPWLLLTLAVAALLGVVASAWVSALIRRRIYGLEPEEIAGLFEGRDAMLHGIREGLVATDEAGRVVLINDAAVRLLAISAPDAALGRPLAGVLEGELDGFITAGSGKERLVLAGERTLLARSDRVHAGERLVGTVVMLRDHTELHDTLRELEGAQSLAEGLRAQAHEFANKLHTLNGLLELGHVEAATALIQREGTGGALGSLEESGGIAVPELAALILAKRSRANELGITLRVGAGSALANTDPGLTDDLLTVVGNLLDNALEACTLGGTIELELSEVAGNITVGVSDDGPGVDPGDRELVFTAGTTSKADRRGGTGRGLGLALVRRVATRLGGGATIDDAASGGCRVTVVLHRGQS